MPFNPDKLAKLVSKNSQSRVGGKGTVRRKTKAIRKNANHDDKRLKTTLNKLGVRDIPAIEEVNLFKDDGHVVHFGNPKVQASISANTYVISGNAQTKKLQDLLPGIIDQLGPESMDDLKKIYQSYAAQAGAAQAGEEQDDDDDDDVPELVENFEEVSEQTV